MRDLLSKLDAIISETALRDREDLEAKRKALDDLESDPVAKADPEISAAIDQRRTDLEKEAKSKGFSESFEIGDEFGISFTEDFEIATEITDILEDGIVIDLDDIALEMLAKEGLVFLEGEIIREEKKKGTHGKACWKGYRRVGQNDCTKIGESGLQRYTGIKKYGKDGFEALQKAGREGADEEEKGRIKDKFLKKEDHGPENPDDPVNYGEYDREGDMAKDQLRTIDDAAEELYSIIQANENLPEWVQAKITKAVDYLDTARDYMKSNKYAEDIDESNGKSGLDKHGLVPKQKKVYNQKTTYYRSNTQSKQGGLDKHGLVKGMGKNIKEESDVDEAEYRGKEVPLGKKLPGDVKKSKVYVRKPNGTVVKVNFGDKKMRIKKSNPARRKSFRARHNCKNPGPRWKARYWSCRSW